MNTLPQLIIGGLPPGVGRCTACGTVLHPHPCPTHKQPRTKSRITIAGCSHCGHIMANDKPPRDLTRAEAAELAASPDFPRVRAVVEAAVKRLVG